MNDFIYRMRVLLAINAVAVLSAAVSYAVFNLELFNESYALAAGIALFCLWLIAVQVISMLFIMDRNIAKLFPDHVDEIVDAYRRQAEAGDRLACYMVGRFYEEGTGVGMDLDEAKCWYRRAAAGDLPEARESLSRLEEAA